MQVAISIVIVSEQLSEGLVLEEEIWRGGDEVTTFVALAADLPQMLARTLPDIIVLDARRTREALVMAEHCLGRDDDAVGPQVLVINAPEGQYALGLGWTHASVRQAADIVSTWVGGRAGAGWPEDH